MDLFPEIYGGDVGITALQYACATADQTPANNSVAELFNPALTGTAQLLNAKLLTLVGIVVWGAQAAAVNVSIWNTTNSAVVAGAATLGPNWMDHRRSLSTTVAADAPLGVFTQGNLTPLTPSNSTEIFRGVLASTQLIPYKQPFNEDISPGTGVLVTVTGSARSVVSLIWIERQQTS
jgi:hypothetical protein